LRGISLILTSPCLWYRSSVAVKRPTKGSKRTPDRSEAASGAQKGAWVEGEGKEQKRRVGGEGGRVTIIRLR